MQRISIVGRQRLSLVLALGLVGQALGGRASAHAQAADPPPPGSDAAQVEAGRAAARAKLIEGDGLLKRGAYQDALAVFKDAYALFPSPKIHYNFGLALKGMGRNAEALEAFGRFLAEANDATPDVRARAATSRDELLARVGVVRVTAEVNGASILIDGREIGRTPHPGDIHLDPGPHMLTVDRGSGSPPFTQRLEVRAGAVLSVAARFLDAAGATTAGSNADGAVSAPTSDVGRNGPAMEAPPAWLRPVAWTAAGIGAAALVTGAVSWAVKESKFRSFNADPACDRAFSNDGGPRCHELVESGETARTVGIASFIAAGAFGLGSAAAFVVQGRSAGDGAGPRVASIRCAVEPDGAGRWWGASCAGTF